MTSNLTWSSIMLVSGGLYRVCITSLFLLGTDILKGDSLGLLDITDEVCVTTSCYGNDVMCIGCERSR